MVHLAISSVHSPRGQFFSMLLQSRVTPRDRKHHPLSTLTIYAPLLSSPSSFLFFPFSLNLLLFVQLVIQVVRLLRRPLASTYTLPIPLNTPLFQRRIFGRQTERVSNCASPPWHNIWRGPVPQWPGTWYSDGAISPAFSPHCRTLFNIFPAGES